MSQIDLLIQLKDQLIFFFDELIELMPEEPDLVVLRIFLKDKIPIADVMSYVVTTLVPLKQLVLDKNDEFFINNNILFQTIRTDRVNHFKRIWTTGHLDNEDKETIWRWFKSFIFLAERYAAK